MTLDSSVMNVSMATVAADLNTTITGIQTAITLYTLVMATLMITGGKVGGILGRRRAFGIGLIIYGAGSATTAIAPNLTVLLIGWSFLEGVGAALIMPAIVALVAANFPPDRRAATYGLVAAAGAIAVAVGPLHRRRRHHVLLLALRLRRRGPHRRRDPARARKVNDAETQPVRLDLVGSALPIVGLGMVVYGVLRSSEWGWVLRKPNGPSVLGASPVVWLILVGGLVVYLLLRWDTRLATAGREPLVDPALLRNRQLSGGLMCSSPSS